MATAPGQWSRRQFLKGMIAAGAAPYLVSASALGAAAPPGEAWTMAGANPQRTSWGPEEVAGRLRPVWYRTIEPYISQNVQIIAADGKVFIATARGLYALKAADGETAWVYPTEMPLGHSPTYHNGVLYVGGFDRRLHCIDAATGRRLWTFDGAKAGYRTSPLVAENLVLLGNRDGTFYAVHAHGTPKQGTLAWKYQTEGPINYWSRIQGRRGVLRLDGHARIRPPGGRRQGEVEDRETLRRRVPLVVAGHLAGPGHLRHGAQLPQRPVAGVGGL